MKSAVPWLTALLFPAITCLGQNVAGNPFPEAGSAADAAVFDTSNEVNIVGVITQEVTRADSPSSDYLYFRMDVKSSSAGPASNWAVRMPKPPSAPYAARGPLLVTDYSPEMARLKPGMTVTVRGYRARDGSQRLQLVPLHGPNSLAGVLVGNP